MLIIQMKLFKLKLFRRLYIILFFTLLSSSLFAQVSVDVFDPFYEDLAIWQDMGLITCAPLLKPYPMQEVKRMLQEVLEKGDDEQTRRATEYYNRFFERAYHLGGGGDLAFRFQNIQKEFSLYPSFELNYYIFDLLSISCNINGLITNKLNHTAIKPLYLYSKYDTAEDNVKVGSFYVLPMFNSGIAVGNDEYYFSAGISRTHFGNFFEDSIFISKSAMHHGQFNVVINKTKWSYTHSFLALTATDDFAKNAKPKKFLSLHALEVRPLPWISFGIVDSVIYGNRFEPIYLIPFSAFFISQGLYDFPDNSLIGMFFSIKPYKGLSLDMALNSDDLGFNDIIKFKKDAKWRMSGQFGFSYTMPRSHWFTFIKLDYTFITPYAYSHVSSHKSDAPNYSNYTHSGSSLASSLWPNSDRLNLKLKFRPKHGIDLDFFNTFIRHGNVVESIDDPYILKDYFAKKYNTDGSALTHATVTKEDKNGETFNKHHAFLHSTPFMWQDTIQYINQLGFLLSFHLPILKSGGKMLFSIGYTFEANINSGVIKPIYKPDSHFAGWDEKSIKELANEKGCTEDDIIADILRERDKQLDAWLEDAKKREFNHYLRLSFKITY